jgi:hypothetical protein
MILFGSSAPLIAQQNEAPATDSGGEDIIMGASLDPATCNVDNATPLTFDEAVSNPDLSNEQCVKIDGFWSGRALFLSAADANSKLSNVSKRLAARRVGIYGSERLLTLAPERAKRYTLVGQLHRCETAWPGAMIVMGYCHYTGGPFLIASQAIPRT